ncbi:hypothetical protein [Methanocella conradii]|uniref:hypothetical protein n=1 Tax=Methanocella conradii TaxID=1175444 RepID=UPI00157E271E|nr:hypothetical protein [Methanocella conradii]
MEYTKNIERNYTTEGTELSYSPQRAQREYSPQRFTEATEIIFTTEVHRGHRGFLFPKGGLVAPLGDPLNL